MKQKIAIHRTLVIGCGNPLRSDEGLGWHVVRELLRTGVCHEGEVLTCEHLTPEMAEDISRAPTVLFITATSAGHPGEVVCTEIAPDPAPMSFSPKLTPQAALGLAADLYGECPRAHVLSLCGERFEDGESLSAPVTAAFPELMKHIRELITIAVPA